MDKIPITNDLQTILTNRWTPAEIVDAQGNVIGQFIPKLDDCQKEILASLPTVEEAEAEINAPGRVYSTAEVLERLRGIQ
jgi:hypothetical protein